MHVTSAIDIKQLNKSETGKELLKEGRSGENTLTGLVRKESGENTQISIVCVITVTGLARVDISMLLHGTYKLPSVSKSI